MAQEKSEAIVLRGVDFSETSRILTLLTPHRGKISCLARGARRRNSPLAAVLDSGNHVELIYAWKDGRSVQNLVDAALLASWQPMKRDLESGAYASLLIELVTKTAHDNEPSEAVFRALIRGFEALCQPAGDARSRCCWAVLQLLRIAGFAPHLEAGIQCGEGLAHGSPQGRQAAYPCCRCHGGIRVSHAGLEALRRFAGAVDCPEEALPQAVLPVLARFASCQLETEFRSLRVIEKVLA